jgi:hypothetical protein
VSFSQALIEVYAASRCSVLVARGEQDGAAPISSSAARRERFIARGASRA